MKDIIGKLSNCIRCCNWKPYKWVKKKEFVWKSSSNTLIFPTEDFKDLLLLSIILNDNTNAYKFDVLTFASMLLILYEYNKEKLKNT